jgi:hypothetical protein
MSFEINVYYDQSETTNFSSEIRRSKNMDYPDDFLNGDKSVILFEFFPAHFLLIQYISPNNDEIFVASEARLL